MNKDGRKFRSGAIGCIVLGRGFTSMGLWEWFKEHVLPDLAKILLDIKDAWLRIFGTSKLRTKG